MEWVFVAAILVLLGAKVFLARGQLQRERQHRQGGTQGDSREAPDHLPGHGDG